MNLTKDEDGLEYCENFRYMMRKNLDDPTIDNATLDRTFVEKDSKVEKKTRGKGRRKELSDEEKRKLEEEKNKAEEEERARKLKEEENVKRLDEPLPKLLEDEEKETYEKKYQEIQELFTEITLRQMNQKYEGIGEGEDAPQEEQPDEENKEDEKVEENQDIKDIEEAEKPEAEGEGQGEGDAEAKPKYFGARILHEVSMQYNFRYL